MNDLENMVRHSLLAASETCERVGDFSWRLATVARHIEQRTTGISGRIVQLGLRICWELTGGPPPAGSPSPASPPPDGRTPREGG